MDRIDALRFLLDVAEIGSFSAVARQRSVATSTVSLAIDQMEDEVGTKLMTRSTRKLIFTHEGETFLSDARRIVAEWDAAMAGMREDGSLTGPIRITATNDFGRSRLRPLLDEFQVRHPNVHISLMLSDNAVDLFENRIDLAIRSGPLPDSTLRARLLVRGPRRICAAPAYWDRVGRPKHPDELLKHNCLILDRPGAPLVVWPFKHRDKAISIKVRGDRQVSDGDVLRDWAVRGIGVIAKNEWDIISDVRSGILETVLDDFVAGQVDLYAVHTGSSRRLTALVDYLREELHMVEEAALTS
ncbi:LysR family transcriptional regulator [Rhizobiales bacterium RZME27]|uniref:LysR family transcriptional regulator n=1 Tax=Endobacterium cereale TaxID=2663029 RepID=A0A6A8AB11_9HYPH|nr:LysR family transcriptional regulator [Endobacterium cereale]MEB2847823.1 LysR substrate-binding domain-containing protein [Endobacterium cereale]MQY46840.1 LysR family transcriptional regulator [Endobacterium cereale]